MITVSSAQKARFKAKEDAMRAAGRPVMSHEERLKLIMKPFPQIWIGPTRPWFGVSLTQGSIDLHKLSNGEVPRRRNAD